jgi:hypothetical protein
VWGRTPFGAEIVAALGRWLDGHGIEDLYARFAFVDRRKRALAGVAAEVVQSYPVPGTSAERELRHLGSDFYELWFTAGDRSCRVEYDGKNSLTYAFFHWDGCELFRIQTVDVARLAAVLKRWLSDRAMPSAMGADFPWLSLGPLARYYEEGRPVEGEFITSWDPVERFYKQTNHPRLGDILALIAGIRQAGYDKTLRAGQSLWTLVVSRSRRHGLREDQPSIGFHFREFNRRDGGMDLHVKIGGVEEYSFPQIELTPAVDALLKRLEAEDID